jgi:hypothetical protein
MLFLGVLLCSISGYGMYEIFEERHMEKVFNKRISGVKMIARAIKYFKEHKELKGKLYYFYDRHTTEFFAKYNVEPTKVDDKDVVEIKLEFYKMDGEIVEENQLAEIYNMIIKKYSYEDAKEQIASWSDFVGIMEEKC